MRLTNRKKLSGCGLLCAHTHYLRRSRARKDGASCQLRYSITEDSNTHDRFAVARCAPGVGVIGHVPCEFLVWCDTFCSTEGCLLAKYLGEDNVARLGSAMSLHLSALCHCRSISISRHFLQSEAHVLNKQY